MVVQRFTPILDLPITEQMMDAPTASGVASCMCTDYRGTNRYIYYLPTISLFYRYDCYKNIWVQLPGLLASGSSAVGGSTMVFDPSRGTAGYIWVLWPFSNSDLRFSYYDIGLNVWNACSVVNIVLPFTTDACLCHPCTSYHASGNDDEIYLIGSASTTVYRYLISTNTWDTTPNVLPATATNGCGLYYIPGYDPTKFVCFRGAATNSIYSHSFSSWAGAWDTFTSVLPNTETYALGTHHVPRGVNSRTLFIEPTGTAKIYDVELDHSGGLTATITPRCTLLGPAWSTVRAGNRMAYIKFPDGSEYIYVLGETSVSFVRTQLQW